MTREDLLKGNAEICRQLGKDSRTNCPKQKHLTFIFNPADINRAGGTDLLAIEAVRR